ncbi:MAG: hypothetical protein ACI823_002596, partial [Chitinophagales bacterium]
CLYFGANTPWNHIRLTLGTSDARLDLEANGSKVTCVFSSLRTSKESTFPPLPPLPPGPYC